MDIQSAKEFFMRYNGFGFHMAREEPGLYDEYSKMNISDETKEAWRLEILDEYEKLYYAEYNTVEKEDWGCCLISRFLGVLYDTVTECGKNGKRAMKLISHAIENFDQMHRILIMEDMPNFVCWICNNTDLKEELPPLLDRLVKFEVTIPPDDFGCKNPQERYNKALNDIYQAVREYLL